MKLFEKIKIWFRAKQLKTDKKIIELIRKGMKIEENKECDHRILRKIIDKDLWYICKKCQTVFFVHGAEGWNKKQIPILIDNLKKGLKL